MMTFFRTGGWKANILYLWWIIEFNSMSPLERNVFSAIDPNEKPHILYIDEQDVEHIEQQPYFDSLKWNLVEFEKYFMES